MATGGKGGGGIKGFGEGGVGWGLVISGSPFGSPRGNVCGLMWA